MVGPSASSGLKLIFKSLENASPNLLVHLVKKLQKSQEKYFKKFDLQFVKWEGKNLSTKNFEHSLGEFYKYIKISKCLAEGKTGSQKMRKRKK